MKFCVLKGAPWISSLSVISSFHQLQCCYWFHLLILKLRASLASPKAVLIVFHCHYSASCSDSAVAMLNCPNTEFFSRLVPPTWSLVWTAKYQITSIVLFQTAPSRACSSESCSRRFLLHIISRLPLAKPFSVSVLWQEFKDPISYDWRRNLLSRTLERNWMKMRRIVTGDGFFHLSGIVFAFHSCEVIFIKRFLM